MCEGGRDCVCVSEGGRECVTESKWVFFFLLFSTFLYICTNKLLCDLERHIGSEAAVLELVYGCRTPDSRVSPSHCFPGEFLVCGFNYYMFNSCNGFFCIRDKRACGNQAGTSTPSISLNGNNPR